MNGKNMVPNGGFEEIAEDGKSPLGWVLDRGEDETIEWGSTTDTHSGGRALVVGSPKRGDSTVLSPEFKVKPKTSYTLSFWARGNEPATFGVDLVFDSHSAGLYHYDASPKAATEWRQVSGVFPSLAESTTCQVRFRPRGDIVKSCG